MLIPDQLYYGPNTGVFKSYVLYSRRYHFFSFHMFNLHLDTGGEVTPLTVNPLSSYIVPMCRKGPALRCVCARLFTKISFFHTITTTVHNPLSTPYQFIPETVTMPCTTEMAELVGQKVQ